MNIKIWWEFNKNLDIVIYYSRDRGEHSILCNLKDIKEPDDLAKVIISDIESGKKTIKNFNLNSYIKPIKN
jgi:hypothetical protein